MKRTISFFVAAIMLLSMMPLSALTVFATENSHATINIESASAAPNTYVDVAVNISENPGIASVGLLLSFDEDLTLVGAANGDAFAELTMTSPAQLKNQGSISGSCRFAWLGSENCNETGTILNLRFLVANDAALNKNCIISVSCDDGDVLDDSRNPIPLTANAGKVTIIDYTPGDVDDNGYINMLDVLTLCRYYVDGCKYDPSGYAINIKAEAGDVDANGKINMLDTLSICQYYVDGCKYDPIGYGVKLLPGKRACNHTMQHFEPKAATCTEDGNIEYWYCELCNEYFGDAQGKDIITYDYTVIESQGHNSVTYDAVPATSTTQGYTAGVWCDRCETWIYGHEVIESIAPNESNIAYRHYVRSEDGNGDIGIVSDEYLSTHEIINPNPVTYVEGVGVPELVEGVEIDGEKVSANGYAFLGWYERPEVTANRVYSISAEETGNKILYGIWSKDVYTITYLPDSASSTLPRVADGTFSVDRETSLSAPPEWPNLVWVGWSNDDGQIVKSIPKGTTGNVTLTANWMSKRSQTVPNLNYAQAEPAVVADEEKGIYAFTYEIGDIQNVPIQQVEDGVDGKGFNLVKGMTHEINKTFTQKMEQGEATSVANTIANATTKSDSWTLSEDWNKSTTFSQEHSNEISQEQARKVADAFTNSGKYTLSSGFGGTKEHIDENGKSTKTTTKAEGGLSFSAALKNIITAPLKAGATLVKEIGGAFGLDIKTSKETEKESNETHNDKISTNWNTNEGFEASTALSHTTEFSSSLRQSIRDTYSYGETLDYGGSSSNTVSSSNTSSNSREYVSSVTYSTETGETITVAETLTADAATGYYRKVLAANFKVFAVVIYDMKSNTFSTMSYSLKIKDSEHLFTDYSTVSSFNDYENGVLPFEVPTFVGDYVYGLVGASDGLRIDPESGIVESYGYKDPATGICYKEYNDLTGVYSDPCDTDVIIPRFVVVSLGGSQKKIVPVTGIEASAFSGTTVTSVYLSDRITSIPKGAFENCTSLKYVRGGTIDSIGENAFKNCTSLFELVLPASITDLKDGAFDGVAALSVNVSNTSVFDAAVASGVRKLSVDIENMEGSIDGKKIVTPANMEYFNLCGGGRTFTNVLIESSANTVVLSNITINNNAGVPLYLNSDNVELGFTTITSNGLIIRSDAENMTVTLDGNNYFVSSSENATLSKSIRFIEKEGSSAVGKLRITGNALVYGSATGIQRVSFDSAVHTFVYLTQAEYENMINTHVIHFDANGGTVTQTEKTVSLSDSFGVLPTPTRDYYTFLGWFTEASGGTQVDSDTTSAVADDVTVYAHWELKPLSDWVLASEMPGDAQAAEHQWRFDFTSTSSNPTLPNGWESTGSSSAWGDYGAWSGWSRTAVSGSDSRYVETNTVTDRAAYTNYKYYIYRTSDGYGYGTKNYNTGTSHGTCTKYDEINLRYALPVYKSSLGTYGPYDSSMFSHGDDCYWFFDSSSYVPAVTHTEYRYCDRSLIYTYAIVSTVSPDGNDISNIQTWVKYREK